MKSGCMSFAGSRSKDQTRGVSKRQPAKPSGKINKYKTPPSQPQCAAYNLQWDWFTALICCGQINIFIPQMPLMKSSYRPHCTNRYVRHRLSEGRLSTLQLTLQPSTFPEHGIKSGLELPTNLLNFRKVINYIPPQFKIHLFPFNEKNPSLLHLFSMRWCEQIHAAGAYNREKEGVRERGRCRGRSAGRGIAAERSGAWRGCGRTRWVREEEQGREPLHHGRLPVRVVPSAYTLLPIAPRLVFHSCPSGCNGVPGCLDGWRWGRCWQPLLEHHSILWRSPKTWVITVRHTGEMWPSPGVSFIFPVAFDNFSPPLFSFLSPSSPRSFTRFFPLDPSSLTALRTGAILDPFSL